ncbi:MAG: carbon-nitrogen hydrolase [Elusimicrobia bacterium RIFOXYB2_FULL_49_7]|nr:MAG: carbon-nitrogen hydrolase [Elusimicrobia bacterium RIFOXYB2_FULL_49_7]
MALCQTAVVHDKFANLEKARCVVAQAAAKGAKLAVLPEMFNCPYDTDRFRAYAEPIPAGMSSRFLSALAAEYRIFLVGGSVPEKSGSRFFNSSPVFNPKGKLIALHRKMHLFDVSLKTVKIKESRVLSAGNQVTVFKTPIGPIGLCLCYDLRFPELFRLMLKKKVVGVVIPAAFSIETGMAHWHTLLRTRAIDNQIFIMAASPARAKAPDYPAFGHSLAADPFGRILVEAGEKESLVFFDLDLAVLKTVRSHLPLLRHRRTDLYDVCAK